MDVSVETLRSFLDQAWEVSQAAAPPITLRAQLRTYERNVSTFFAGGTIGSVSKNSTSQTYRGPGLGSYTVVQIANAWRTLLNLFDATKNWIDRELIEDPIQTLGGSVVTSGNGLAVFTTVSAHGINAGQLVTIAGASNAAFNLQDVSVDFIPTATQFSYAISVISPVTNTASVTYSPEYGVPPDNSDLAIYTVMQNRLVVIDSAEIDATNLRLQPTLAPGRSGLVSW